VVENIGARCPNVQIPAPQRHPQQVLACDGQTHVVEASRQAVWAVCRLRARVIVITRSAVVTDHWESQGVLSGGDGKPYTPPLWLAQCTNRHAIDYKCGTRHNTTTTPHYAAPHHTQHAHTHAPTVGVPMPIHETCLELAEYVRRRGALSRVTNFVAREGEDAARPIAGERHAMYFGLCSHAPSSTHIQHEHLHQQS